MNLTHYENHFKKKMESLGNLADEESFTMIFLLIDKVRSQNEEMEKLSALNRHYFFKFYDGSIDKMMKDNAYLLD
ncbi:hypothetical protein V7150_16235 [Neobacillus drentensis]|uniref:hypothetical protein n=1 Tax=Neobacillus drentensis TaxID=220684 RepID=UPI002FFDCA4A